MVLQQEILAENWSGTIEIRSGLNGAVHNNNVARYAPYNKRHLQTLSATQTAKEYLELACRTVQSRIEIALLARTQLLLQGKPISCNRTVHTEADSISERLQAKLAEGEMLVVEKVAALYTTQDPAVSDAREAARKALEEAGNFHELFSAHCGAWKKLWQQCELDMIPKEQLPYFRLHIFQILQNISLHTADMDVGVPPSGWQGEEYHGQIFWDEMFIFPFLAYRFPTIARSLLLYRYRRLNAARALAKKAGYRGAMFPWRSASSGREETPLLQYNLYSGHWLEDYTYLQRHIGAIIAYSICNYAEVTGDSSFMADYGAEMLLEIARFWASIAEYNPQLDRYEIRGVVGPDEHHTHYPGANTSNPAGRGINNNTYTNVMGAWTLMRAGQLFSQVSAPQQQALQELIDLRPEELEDWKRISRRMFLVFLEDGTLDQFEGFSQLKSFDLEQFRQEWGNKRVDWTLEARGDSVINYKISKQADTSLLLYLFTPTELQKMLQYMGYHTTLQDLKRTVDKHIAHTANESSLSKIIHAGALSHFDLSASWKLFCEAQMIDLRPKEDDDSSEGIHLGAMGATLGVLQHHYLGIEVQSNALNLHPALPDELEYTTIGLQFRGVALECKINHQYLWVSSSDQKALPVTIKHADDNYTLEGGATIRISIRP